MNKATRIAYYEAGHITVLYLCGWDLARVTNTREKKDSRPFDDYDRWLTCTADAPLRHHDLIEFWILEELSDLELALLGGPAAEQLAIGKHTRHVPKRAWNKEDVDFTRGHEKRFDELWQTVRDVLSVPEVWNCVREVAETLAESADGLTGEEVLWPILRRRLPF